MASSLRPTPETGRVAATKMPASSIGPSWSQRGSREARLAFRQAQKRGDREGAMRIAGEAEEQGYASQASIGSAEDRAADQYQGRQKDTAITAEIETALTPPGLSRADGQPRITMDMRRGDPGFQDQTGPTLADRYRSAQEVLGGASVRTAEPSATRPPIPEAPTVPGASQPPENPVTGSSVPATGDASTRLGQRRVNPLTGKPIGYDPRNPSPVDVMSRVRELTSAEGGDMMRGAAIRQANAERAAAGQTPVDYDQTLDDLQTGDREAEATQRTGRRLNAGPTLSVDPVLARSFGTPARGTSRTAPTPAPSRASPVGGSPAPATIAPSSGPLAPSRPPSALKNLIERGKENVRGTAFEGSKGYDASLAVGDFLTETLPDTAEDAKRRAIALAQQGRTRAVAAVRSARDRALEKTKGTAFEGSRAYQLLTR